MDIIPNGPETPDPTQLDLFGFNAQETGPVQDSADSVESISTNDPMIRSPTAHESFHNENGKKFDLNEAQKRFASSLHRKSRELASKPRPIHPEEEDLAR